MGRSIQFPPCEETLLENKDSLPLGGIGLGSCFGVSCILVLTVAFLKLGFGSYHYDNDAWVYGKNLLVFIISFVPA